jgi:hypothetical protein
VHLAGLLCLLAAFIAYMLLRVGLRLGSPLLQNDWFSACSSHIGILYIYDIIDVLLILYFYGNYYVVFDFFAYIYILLAAFIFE